MIIKKHKNLLTYLNLKYIIRKIADELDIKEDEVVEITTENAKAYTKNAIYDIKHLWLCVNLKIDYIGAFQTGTKYNHVEIDLCDVSGLNFVKEYKEFILEQLNLLDNITCKAMMGEFLLYYNDVLFGGIYDNRLLVKIVDTNKKYNMSEQIPYESAKPMYLVDDVDNKELLKEIVINTCKGLPNKE